MEAYRDLLVIMDDPDRWSTVVDIAVHVAARAGARLAGLYVEHPIVVSSLSHPEAAAGFWLSESTMPPISGEPAESTAHGQADRARALLDKQAAGTGISVDWRVTDANPNEAATLHARTSDLVVIGQTDPAVARELPERVLLNGGRPVLVVPRAGTFPTIGERAVIAWNASREATRAVHDALPFLRSAAHVTVLTINIPHGVASMEEPGGDLIRHLACHGVHADRAATVGDVAVAAMLLSRLADLQADLLVMGGYGHSRMREIILGGVTREILGAMTVPTLLSH